MVCHFCFCLSDIVESGKRSFSVCVCVFVFIIIDVICVKNEWYWTYFYYYCITTMDVCICIFFCENNKNNWNQKTAKWERAVAYLCVMTHPVYSVAPVRYHRVRCCSICALTHVFVLLFPADYAPQRTCIEYVCIPQRADSQSSESPYCRVSGALWIHKQTTEK